MDFIHITYSLAREKLLLLINMGLSEITEIGM